MPGMDRTGPFGNGPMSRGFGPCEWRQAGRGVGRGFFRGGEAGWDSMPISLTPVEEKDALERQKKWLERQLTTITKRLLRLEENADPDAIEPVDQ